MSGFHAAGVLEIHGGFTDNHITDLELSYNGRSYTGNTNNLEIVQTRKGSYNRIYTGYNGGNITKARIGNNGDSSSGVFLDIYAGYATSAMEYTVKARGLSRGKLLVTPQYNPTINAPQVYREINLEWSN